MKPVSEQLWDYDFTDHGAEGILDCYAFVQRKAAEVAKLEAENELLWMYYKANKESDYDSFQEAEKRIIALGGESEGFFCPKCGNVYPKNEMRCLTCNPIKKR